MKYEKRSLKLVLFLVMIGILLSCSAGKNYDITGIYYQIQCKIK